MVTASRKLYVIEQKAYLDKKVVARENPPRPRPFLCLYVYELPVVPLLAFYY